MASNRNRQPAARSKTKPNPPKKAAPKKRAPEKEAPTPGSIMWRMGILLCTGLVVVGLLFSSIVGGSQYVGLTEQETTKATPTPPTEMTDPTLNIEGSELTPIPPSASPEGGTTEEGTTTEQPTP